MNIKLMTQVMVDDTHEAKILRAIMFSVFEDFVLDCSKEDFQTRFGTMGVICLEKYTKKTGI